jgi:transposase
MKQKRKRYDDAFKRKAVEHLEQTNKNISQLASELDITTKNLSAWKRKYGADRNVSPKEQQFIDYDRLKKLEQQNRELAEENEILKKAMHFFTKNRD